MSSTAVSEERQPVPGYARLDDPDERRAYLWSSFVIAIGWLATNVGLQVATLPLKFVLKNEVLLSATALSGFFAIGHFSNYVKPLAGVMTDSIPLCGTRRRHYLLFSLVATGIGWIVLSLVPRTYGWMLPVYTLMYVGVVFTSSTLGGVMVEAGNRFRAAGRFTSQRVAMFKLAEITGGPLGGWMATFPFVVPACLGALLHLALAPFLMRYLPKEPKATLDSSAWKEIVRQGKVLVSSRTLLGAAAMIFLLAASPGMNTPLFFYQTNVLRFEGPFIGLLAPVGALGGMAAAAAYYPLCRRFNLRTLVAASIVLHALGGLTYLAYHSHQSAIVISIIAGACNTLAMLPVYDIALRATPKGSEAIGYAVMMSMWNLTNALSDIVGAYIFEWVGRSLTPLIWIDAVSTLAVIVAVPFMPRALSTRESELAK
jgi:predicted MFS family arabinose efflux permease